AAGEILPFGEAGDVAHEEHPELVSAIKTVTEFFRADPPGGVRRMPMSITYAAASDYYYQHVVTHPGYIYREASTAVLKGIIQYITDLIFEFGPGLGDKTADIISQKMDYSLWLAKQGGEDWKLK